MISSVRTLWIFKSRKTIYIWIYEYMNIWIYESMICIACLCKQIYHTSMCISCGSCPKKQMVIGSKRGYGSPMILIHAKDVRDVPLEMPMTCLQDVASHVCQRVCNIPPSICHLVSGWCPSLPLWRDPWNSKWTNPWCGKPRRFKPSPITCQK